MEKKRHRITQVEDRFPFKVELHIHLDGAFRISSLLEIARNKNIDVKSSDIDEFRKNVCVYDAHSLKKVLASFEIFMPIVAGDREAISRLAYDFCEDCSHRNIRYVEARYSPHLLASSTDKKPQYSAEQGDLTPREVVQLVNESFKRGSKDFNIKIKSILCCVRYRPDWSEELVDLANEFKTDGVVAIDIVSASGNDENIEEIFPAHKAAFKRAKDLGLHITAHAGEAGSAYMVQESLDDLFAERIGHGYRVLEDEAVYAEVCKKQVHLETCPISSICTGAVPKDIHLHPVVRFAHDGVNFSLNSDDPLVFDSCLLDDYISAREMGLTDDQIIKSIFNAAKASFANEDEKQEVLRELAETYGEQFMSEK